MSVFNNFNINMKKNLLILVSLFLLSSCATIISGTTTSVNLSPSDPEAENVKVQVQSKYSVQNITLPGSVMIKKSSGPIDIIVKDKCFREQTTTINSTVDYWFLGNIITGGLIGTTTDALSGALWTYDDTAVVDVVPNGTCKPEK